ncbi:hypothetical protein [Desulfobulbus oligotrophicus]|uniref:Uncharacterized protein n=1 Tax=Desulfobulbus oligotrophicus TaxID=1909699 RepID=A0A7T5VEJ9_9BACT|nr:hypothetical protein [Desulfobulbus oligotrophicus]QQG66346.1 hypothetical protein HP555_10945 [Desulfobulbus oligotrophicus]
MMSIRRLKIKDELHYRRGYTHASCGGCDHYVPDSLCADGELWDAPRCRIIGVKRGRLFRINDNNICDRYDNTENIKRCRGW